MNPNRVDFLIDLAYGVLIFVAIVLIVAIGTGIGVAFGLGALVSYIIHVGWKMARFDPDWMTKEVAENIEETLTEEVTESVSEKVTDEMAGEVEEKVAKEVTENVGEQVTEEVTRSLEETLSDQIESVIGQLEAVNERIDRRPRADEIEEQVDELARERRDEDRGEASTGEGAKNGGEGE